MSKNKIIIIGANEFQYKLVEKANELDYETHVFAWEDGSLAKDIADYFYPVSIINKEEILEVCKNIQPNAVVSIASDLAVPTVNYIAEHLNLIGNSSVCTKVTTDKFLMREKLTQHLLPCPKYQLIKSIDDINFGEWTFPIIIKPIDRSGSRGIFKCISIEEVTEGIGYAKAVSNSKYLLIEEYIDGREFSVEYITQNGIHHFLQITEKFTSGDPHFIEYAHLAPARLDRETEIRILNIIQNALNALEIKNGASHSEIKINSYNEIKIIEIASRMGGDFIGSDLLKYSTGYDYVKNTINVSLGYPIEHPNILPRRKTFVGFFFNLDDFNRYLDIKSEFSSHILEDSFPRDIKNVVDSSTRNGYFIIDLEYIDVNLILNYSSQKHQSDDLKS